MSYESLGGSVPAIAFLIVLAGGAYFTLLLASGMTRRGGTPVRGDGDLDAADAGGADFTCWFMIPALNEELVIEATVTKLLAGDPRARVIVIDDASDDTTREIVLRCAERDDRVTLLARQMPNARIGKGEALNHGFAHLRRVINDQRIDAAKVVVGVMDADGPLSERVVSHVLAEFADPEVGGVQLPVRIRNRGSFLTNIQDFEFWGMSAIAQIGRRRTGTVSMGGNGQFTRLVALLELGDRPWSESLTEDLDLTVSLACNGWRLSSTPDAHVSQQGVESVRALLRQRTRWFQGHIVCSSRVMELWRTKTLRNESVLELTMYLLTPLLMALPWSILFHVGLVYAWNLHQSDPGFVLFGSSLLARGSRLVAWYVLSFFPAWVTGVVYARRVDHTTWGKAVLYGHAVVGFSYVTWVACWRALFRIILGRRGWTKTARVAEAPEVTANSGGTGRDSALDLLRTFALGRVVVWHTFPTAALTWFAAMPLMFFLSGIFLARSAGRSPLRTLVMRRTRRLLVPFWMFALAVGVVSWAQSGRPFALFEGVGARALAWALPLVDPLAPSWQGGWLAEHLWYLRAYLIVVLLTWVIIAMARRWKMSAVAAVGAVAAMELADHANVGPFLAGQWRAVPGDLAAYGLFAMLGAAWELHGRALHREALITAGLIAGLSAAAWASFVGLPDGVVNDSYPMIVLTGVTWLCLVGAAAPAIRKVASMATVTRFSRLVSRRAMTIYLWHLVGVVIARNLIEVETVFGGAAVLLVVAAVTFGAVLTVGWVEDLAGGVKPELAYWKRAPRPPTTRWAPLLVASTVSLFAAALVVPGPLASIGGDDSTLRAPSARPGIDDGQFDHQAPAAVPTPPPPSAEMPTGDLQTALDEWLDQVDDGPRSVSVTVLMGDELWSGHAAEAGTEVRDPAEGYNVASLTKMFTATLVLEAAADDLIDLDAPMPALPGLPTVPSSVVVTPRHLLQHASGLKDFMEVDGYEPGSVSDPVEAVASSINAGFVSAPGSNLHYANSNYLWLGLLLEEVTGEDYDTLVADLVERAGLKHTGPSSDGGATGVGFSSGGVRSTQEDLVRFADALLDDGSILDPEWLSKMTEIGDLNIGLGVWPQCPCSTDATGAKSAVALGHHVGDGGLWVYPGRVTLLVRFQPGGEHAIEWSADVAEDLLVVLEAA